MEKVKEKYREKCDYAESVMKEVMEFSNKKAAVCIGDVNYWTFGELQSAIPEDYYSNPESSLQYQLDKIEFHDTHFENDVYQPFLHPWFGTGVLASAFDIPVIFNYKQDPAVNLSKMERPEEIDDLKMPEAGVSGIMDKVTMTLDHYKSRCDLPVGVTDCQGPLTTALQVAGYDKFCYWVYDDPKRVHRLMEMVTDALIEWVRFQKKRAGTEMESACYPLAVKIPDGYGGAWIADDDSVIMSAHLYKEFVKPYNEKMLNAFGGGVIHYCGNSTQNIENYVETKGLLAIHNMNLDDLVSAKKMRDAAVKKGIVFMAGDFVPNDGRYKNYYTELLDAMGSPEGLVICPYVAPAIELEKGKYNPAVRNSKELAVNVMNVLQDLIK